MATNKSESENVKKEETQQPTNLELVILETRKVKAMEKIANSLDALTIWFEEIDKKDWSERIAYYLYEFHTIAKSNNPSTVEETLNEGRYDSIVTQLARYTIKGWKDDQEHGEPIGRVEFEVGPGKDLEYGDLEFLYKLSDLMPGFGSEIFGVAVK